MVFTARELTYIRRIHEVWYTSVKTRTPHRSTVCQLQCGHIVTLDGTWYAGEHVVCDSCKRLDEQAR